MKRIIISIAIAGTLIAGVLQTIYWDAHPTANHKTQLIAGAKTEKPATFANLTLTSSSDEYAEHIHTLGRTVSEKEQNALAAWITGPKPAQFTDSAWRYLVNEVMDSLCHQNGTLTTWTDTLINIAHRKTYDPGLRDYAIQHLVERIQPLQLGEPYETNPKKRQTIITTLLEAAGQIQEGYSGTALQGLHVILQDRQRSQQQNEPSATHPLPLTAEQLRPLAVHLATADNATHQARTTALQVCAERGFSEILPTARSIATDANQPIPLRRSAIAAIGMLGNGEDESLLERLRLDCPAALLRAIKPAQERLEKQKGPRENVTRCLSNFNSIVSKADIWYLTHTFATRSFHLPSPQETWRRPNSQDFQETNSKPQETNRTPAPPNIFI